MKRIDSIERCRDAFNLISTVVIIFSYINIRQLRDINSACKRRRFRKTRISFSHLFHRDHVRAVDRMTDTFSDVV